MKKISLFVMALFYSLAGVIHLVKPVVFRAIVPPYLPYHDLLILLSGIAELILGISLFFQKTRVLAAWGIIALLIAVFPANIYMFQARQTAFQNIPAWVLLLRLPAQGLLIWAAFYFARKPKL